MEYQTTSKGSDQTAVCAGLVRAFSGHKYHIVGNLMSWLIYYKRLNSTRINGKDLAREFFSLVVVAGVLSKVM